LSVAAISSEQGTTPAKTASQEPSMPYTVKLLHGTTGEDWRTGSSRRPFRCGQSSISAATSQIYGVLGVAQQLASTIHDTVLCAHSSMLAVRLSRCGWQVQLVLFLRFTLQHRTAHLSLSAARPSPTSASASTSLQTSPAPVNNVSGRCHE
jgi:hypothetical protein